MKYFCSVLFFCCFFWGVTTAQEDTARAKPDSMTGIQKEIITDTSARKDFLFRTADSAFLHNDSSVKQLPGTGIRKPVVDEGKTSDTKNGIPKSFSGKEILFYYLLFLFLFFGLLRRGFSKYFNDLFRIFFRTTLKQKQVREQLLQSPLPSVLMNFFFVLSAGLYVQFQLVYFHLSITDSFWLQYVYCAGALALIYIIKFLGLKFIGWILHVQEATESYTFIVFTINKMLGIVLLPFLLCLAFSSEPLYDITIRLSWILVFLFIVYRIFLTYNVVRKEIKLNPFHFFLYVMAFEIIPLLLIYKMLLIIF